MFGWDLLKLVTTFCSALSWLGSSPPPRQQNHLIVTGPPGGTVARAAEADAEGLPPDGLSPEALATADAPTPVDSAAVVGADDAPDEAGDDGLAFELPPLHPATTSTPAARSPAS